MTALGARRAVTEPITLADALTRALARPTVSIAAWPPGEISHSAKSLAAVG